MIVSELIAYLQKQPQDLIVAYDKYSEHCLMSEGDIEIENACNPRPDGWIERERDDKPSRQYLMFP